MVTELAIPQKRDESVKITMPQVKIFFLPYMSAILPKGTRRVAEDRSKAVAIQPNMTAFNDSSFPSEGRAIFTADPIKGKMNAAIVATRSTTPLLVPLPTGASIIGQFNLFTEDFSSPGRHSFLVIAKLESVIVGLRDLA